MRESPSAPRLRLSFEAGTKDETDDRDMAQLALFRAGVGAARKGWLAKKHILNTRPLTEVKRFLPAKRGND